MSILRSATARSSSAEISAAASCTAWMYGESSTSTPLDAICSIICSDSRRKRSLQAKAESSLRIACWISTPSSPERAASSCVVAWLSCADLAIRSTSTSTSAKAWWILLCAAPPAPSARSSRLKLSIRESSVPTVPMIAFEDASTCAARSFTASATTPKPRPASPARLASTDALNATSRVCSAIFVISDAASLTSRSVETISPTSSPTPDSAVRARPTASRVWFVDWLMPSCACRTCSSSAPSACIACACEVTTFCVSSSSPRTSAASRPSLDTPPDSSRTTVVVLPCIVGSRGPIPAPPSDASGDAFPARLRNESHIGRSPMVFGPQGLRPLCGPFYQSRSFTRNRAIA